MNFISVPDKNIAPDIKKLLDEYGDSVLRMSSFTLKMYI